MQHIPTERLAALADEPTAPDEAAHLGHCLACRRERDEYVALLDLARREGAAGVEPGVLAAVGDPLTSWDTLVAGLRDEGLVDDGRFTHARAPAAAGRRRSAGGAASRWWLQAAAASVLLAAGAAGGRATVGESPLPWRFGDANVAADALAGAPSGAPAATAFDDVAEAAEALARAQREYQRASAYLAVHDTSTLVGGSDALRARLAALDELIPRVRDALSDAPQDPVLNEYYQTTYDARETTIRQLGRSLPVGVRLTGY